MEEKLNVRAMMDPMGLLSEPTSEEMKEWENSPHFSDNPYVLIGWLVNHRKRKMEELFEKKYSLLNSDMPEEKIVFKLPKLDKK